MPSHTFTMEYIRSIYARYHKALREEKSRILDEFCRTAHIHRKHAIRKLSGPKPDKEEARRRKSRGRTFRYGPSIITLLRQFWTASGHLCGQRLKAALPDWLPWARQSWQIDPASERLLLAISPSQIDRRLAPYKKQLKKSLYGTTRSGRLLKHMIPIRTDFWNVKKAGYNEVDLVAHCGSRSDGDFGNTLTSTDIKTTWTDRRAVLGKSQIAVAKGMAHIESRSPFPWLGIDSDNGSEFINDHLWSYCRQRPPHRKIQFTRSRPYKKDDNAHVEQKNWTHVRQRIGYARYDTEAALTLMNDIYNDLFILDNIFLPSQKLLKKIRLGSRLIRRYDKPTTALNRLIDCPEALPDKIKNLLALRQSTDPFALAERIERKIEKLQTLASKPTGKIRIPRAPT
ncbi:MAG: hypothetical protein ACRDRT_09455, partial [Pseudonocardiaceae bacterium]